MQIVIDIPESLYRFYKTLIGYGKLKVEEDILGRLLNDGIVLPKGHGDLIDRSLEARKFIDVEHKTLKTDDELSAYQSGWNTAIDEIIKHAPIVIPADKGE